MRTFSYRGRAYTLDDHGFLADRRDWDEAFAEGMAEHLGIPGGLGPRRWQVLRFIRAQYGSTGRCPVVYVVCRENGLSRRDFQELFPRGYLRGACRLGGITYRDRFIRSIGEARRAGPGQTSAPPAERLPGEPSYRVDAWGFLIDPAEWDELFAAQKCEELKMPGGWTEERRRIVTYLREQHARHREVPTFLQCCQDNGLEIEELERLFPDGYHRGAVKIAGLRVLGAPAAPTRSGAPAEGEVAAPEV